MSPAAAEQSPCVTIADSLAFLGNAVANSLHRLLPIYLIFLVATFVVSSVRAQQEPSSDFDSLSKAAAAARDSARPAASKDYLEATRWDPSFAEAFLNLGESNERLKDRKGARDAYEKYLALAPDAPGIQTFLGLCEFETADYDAALQHLENGYTSDPHDDPQLTRVATYHLVLLLNRAGRFNRAEELLSRDLARGASSEQIT